MEQLIEEVKQILDGINKDSLYTDAEGETLGWWETSCGVEFGAEKLEAVINAIKKHCEEK
jgi:hypothetical protein